MIQSCQMKFKQDACNSQMYYTNFYFDIKALDNHQEQKNHSLSMSGDVIGSVDTFDMMITQLASTSVNIPLRWSFGKYIGGGAVGSVYVGLNLETGG